MRAAIGLEALIGRPSDAAAALMRAAMTGDTEALKVLINKGLNANARDEYGRTPLIEAAFGGHIEAIELLLNRAADVHAQDNDGWTALMEATSKGHVEAVRILLVNGAAPDTKSRNGWTAFKVIPKGNAEIANLLRQAVTKR